MASKEFSGKVVLITGASSGIGAETAINFSKLGASLALTGRNLEHLKQTQEKCSDSPKVLLITADVTKSNDLKQIMEKTIQEFGKLDVLVNNAGIGSTGTIETTNMETLDKTLNTNVRPIFELTQLAIPYLKATKGNIVNVSSVLGIRAYSNLLSYSMSKSCLDQFTKCISLELAPYQIRVNSVNPTAVLKTDFFRNVGLNEEKIKNYCETEKDKHPLGRLCEPEDVSNAIIFFASEKAAFVTGVLFPVTGGRH